MHEVTTIPVDVIIVTYKTPELTLRALSALHNSSVRPKSIVVVDNNSEDDTLERIKAQFPKVHTIHNEKNVGFAKANNQALKITAEPFVWLLNSDTEVGSKSLEDLYQFMLAHPRVGAAGPQLVYPDRSLQSTGGNFPSVLNVFSYLIPYAYFFPLSIKRRLSSLALYPQPIPQEGKTVDYVTGAAIMLRREVLNQVGFLSEDYFMYFEETDLCWRMRLAGWDRFVVPTDPVMHVYGGSYKTRHDTRRLKTFLKSLDIFITNWYSGSERFIMKAEIALLGWLSTTIKRVKSYL